MRRLSGQPSKSRPPEWLEDPRARLAAHVEALRTLEAIPPGERDRFTVGSMLYHRDSIRYLLAGLEEPL